VSEAESELSGAGGRARVWGYRVGGAILAASVAYCLDFFIFSCG
jgi:hypothetical protein